MKYFIITIMFLSLTFNVQGQDEVSIVETYGVTSMFKGNYDKTTGEIVNKEDIYPKDIKVTVQITKKKSIWITFGLNPVIMCDNLISYKPYANYDEYIFRSIVFGTTPAKYKTVRIYSNPKRIELLNNIPVILQFYIKKIKTGSLYTK